MRWSSHLYQSTCSRCRSADEVLLDEGRATDSGQRPLLERAKPGGRAGPGASPRGRGGPDMAVRWCRAAVEQTEPALKWRSGAAYAAEGVVAVKSSQLTPLPVRIGQVCQSGSSPNGSQHETLHVSGSQPHSDEQHHSISHDTAFWAHNAQHVDAHRYSDRDRQGKSKTGRGKKRVERQPRQTARPPTGGTS